LEVTGLASLEQKRVVNEKVSVEAAKKAAEAAAPVKPAEPAK
jgi:hypothetical protein